MFAAIVGAESSPLPVFQLLASNIRGKIRIDQADVTKLRILFVLPSLDVGGAESMTISLADNLAKRGHAVSIVCTRRRGSLATSVNDEIIELMAPEDGVGFMSLFRIIRNSRPDVVHVHMGPWAKASIAAKLAGANTVIATLHGVPEDQSLFRVLSRRTGARFTDRVALVSPALAEYTEQKLRIDSSIVTVILNGVDMERFSPNCQARDLHGQLGLPRNGKIVGTVARLASIKNQALLVKAVASLNEHIHLVLVGDGECRHALQALALELGISNRVHFAGLIKNTESAYVAFDVFALSSLAEGTPMCILEAMACATPIVSTAVGGIPELLEDGQSGVLVESDNLSGFTRALANVLSKDNSAVTEHARTACRDRFSIDAMIDAYEELYRAC